MIALRSLCYGALVTALVLTMPGCSRDKPVKVNGVVTLDGKPVPNAIVRFIPEDKDGREAVGMTNSEGAFRLTTFRTNDGALRGSYKITVETQTASSAQDVAQIGQGGKTIKDVWDDVQKDLKARKDKPEVVIPDKYKNPSKTLLKETVPTEGKVVLELTSK